MKKVLIGLLMITLYAVAQPGQSKYQGRSGYQQSIIWNDLHKSLQDSIRNIVGDSASANITDSLNALTASNGVVYDASGRNFSQKIVKDTTTLKAYTVDSVGTTVFLKQLASGNTNGGGLFVYRDSSIVEDKWNAFNATTQGKQWQRLDAFAQARDDSLTLWGPNSLAATNNQLLWAGWNPTGNNWQYGRVESKYFSGVNLNNVTLGSDVGNIRIQVDNTSAHIGLNVGGTAYSHFTVETNAQGNGYIQVRGANRADNSDPNEFVQLLQTDSAAYLSTMKGHLRIWASDSILIAKPIKGGFTKTPITFTDEVILKDSLSAGSSGFVEISDALRFWGDIGNNQVINCIDHGAGNGAFVLNSNGSMEWGSGAAPRDVNLYRPVGRANNLYTPDTLNSEAIILADEVKIIYSDSLYFVIGSDTFVVRSKK